MFSLFLGTTVFPFELTQCCFLIWNKFAADGAPWSKFPHFCPKIISHLYLITSKNLIHIHNSYPQLLDLTSSNHIVIFFGKCNHISLILGLWKNIENSGNSGKEGSTFCIYIEQCAEPLYELNSTLMYISVV